MKQIIKTGFVFVFLVFIFSNCKAQRLKYDDLLYALNHSLGDIEHRLINKGIPFDDVYEMDDGIQSHDFSIVDNSLNFISFSLTVFDDKIFAADITTLDQKEYLQLRNAIIELGYTYTRNITKNKLTLNFYRKNNYEVRFDSGAFSDGTKRYNVTLTNINLQDEVYQEIDKRKKYLQINLNH